MSNNTERAWTCINRWRRRGYVGQVEIFEEVMAENERLRVWNEEIALNARHFAESLRLIRDMGPMTVDDQRWRIAKDALEGK